MKKRKKSYRRICSLLTGLFFMLFQSGCSRIQTQEDLSGQVILSSQRQEESAAGADSAGDDLMAEQAAGFGAEGLTSGGDAQAALTGVGVPDSTAQSLQAGEDSAERQDPKQSGLEQPDPGQTLPDIYVHICGEVQNPGVYRLPAGSRVYEGLEQAGGLLPTAASDAVNQALVLEDGMQVQIPSAEVFEAAGKGGSYITDKTGKAVGTGKETQALGAASGISGTDISGSDTGVINGKININTAGEAELRLLNGIGESRAKSIIRYRETHGSFARIEDIMKVEGIKEGAFAKIKDDITVE